MNAVQVARIGDAVTELCDELDDLVTRIVRADPLLSLLTTYPTGRYRSKDATYTILDIANGMVRMLPPTSKETCVRFAVAFRDRHPWARLDDSFGLFADVLSEREPSVAAAHRVGRTVEPASRSESTPSSAGEPVGGAGLAESRISRPESPVSRPGYPKAEVASPAENHSVCVPLADVIQIRPGKVVA